MKQNLPAFNYDHDALGRRTQRTDLRPLDLGLSTNSFGYNPRSELTNALMSGSAYAYAYDNIGNRTGCSVGSQSQIYSANELNQYTNIAGAVTNTPTYDADGNLLTYNGWTYSWDGENRLTQASNATTVVMYVYDQQGRMAKKVVNGVTNRFVWDGMNMIAEISATSTNLNVWGLDMSGTRQGAGGVGGLLSVTVAGALTPSPFFPCFDANGNITEYVGTNGTVAAHYEYDPYGNITHASGLKSQDFTFRFSTKPLETETGLIHYQFRAYVSALGRWLSRDPKQEKGGINLYVSCGNDGVGNVDYLGLTQLDQETQAALDAAQRQIDASFQGMNDEVTTNNKDGSINEVNPKDRAAELEKMGEQALSLVSATVTVVDFFAPALGAQYLYDYMFHDWAMNKWMKGCGCHK